MFRLHYKTPFFLFLTYFVYPKPWSNGHKIVI